MTNKTIKCEEIIERNAGYEMQAIDYDGEILTTHISRTIGKPSTGIYKLKINKLWRSKPRLAVALGEYVLMEGKK